MNSLIINRFDKSFGPAGSFAGLVLVLAGIVVIFYSYTGLFVLLIGAFVAFTNTSVAIDTGNKRIKYSQNICGIFKMGRWIDIQPEMQIRIVQNNLVFRAYSLSNRRIESKSKRFKIILVTRNGQSDIPLKYANNINEARQTAQQLADNLEISYIQ